MKAVILVGGMATRLLPLTSFTPKALVPVLNVPFLEHVIRHLARHRISDIILAQGHLAQPIEEFLGGGGRFGVRLSYVTEDEPRGTGGAVKNAAEFIDDTFMVLNGDIFTDLDYTAMIDFHKKNKALVTISLATVDDPTSFGVVEFDTRSRITSFIEKPAKEDVTTNTINAGVYILERRFLDEIPRGMHCSAERGVFPELLKRGEPLYAYSSDNYWIDIGTPEKYLALNRDILNGHCRQYALDLDGEVTVGKGATINPGARISGPVLIGANSSVENGVAITGPVVIGRDCTVLGASVIDSSVIWDNVRLGPQTHVENSIIADNCILESGSVCRDAVLGIGVTVACDGRIEPGIRIEPGTAIT